MASISTHVLDTALGRPAAGVPVTLERLDGRDFLLVGSGVTDSDGRNRSLVPEGAFAEGTWRITFDTAAYYATQDVDGFYPQVQIVFIVRDASEHHHVPLLLSPFGFSTYRGS